MPSVTGPRIGKVEFSYFTGALVANFAKLADFHPRTTKHLSHEWIGREPFLQGSFDASLLIYRFEKLKNDACRVHERRVHH